MLTTTNKKRCYPISPYIPRNIQNTRHTRIYPKIAETPRNAWELKRYPEIPNSIFRHSYATWAQPATWYFVYYLTQSDPILKKKHLLGTESEMNVYPHWRFSFNRIWMHLSKSLTLWWHHRQIQFVPVIKFLLLLVWPPIKYCWD